ncbi:MAG: hypothetical protein IJG48_04645 [Mogibacterium sp.]|nr:hypothetical protein [Mogibacterium sp.]
MKRSKKAKRIIACTLGAVMICGMCACAGQSVENTAADAVAYLTKEDITVNETISNDADGEHAIEVSGEEASYSNTGVTKTGNADGDEADFYGENSAVFATEKGTLTISDSLIETNGTHANAVFSYGEGTTVNIANSVIETQGDCSGGIMTTGGGTMNAENLTINTSGRSSAAIRSDRGGGIVNVSKGYYKTTGTGSPVVYSTADITVSDAYMESTASQGIVVEGKNSGTLNNDTLIADNNTKNSDKSDYYQAVMIYQSMSGDAAEGTSSFTANGGSITNKNGDIFFVNNTATEISLSGVEITNEDAEGVFLRAEAAGWGNEGSNGGKVNMTASGQVINGNMLVDDISTLNLYLKDKSAFTGSINSEGQSGDVYIEIEDGSTWTLTADSYVSGLTVNEGSAIDLNGHKLYIDGKEYTAGSSSKGEAFDISTGSGSGSGMPDGNSDPGGNPPDGNKPDGEPPEKPDGNGSPGGNPPSGEPPEKPDSNN